MDQLDKVNKHTTELLFNSCLCAHVCLCPERKLVPSVIESTVPSRCMTPSAFEVRSPLRSLTSSPLSLPLDNEDLQHPHPVPKWVCETVLFLKLLYCKLLQTRLLLKCVILVFRKRMTLHPDHLCLSTMMRTHRLLSRPYLKKHRSSDTLLFVASRDSLMRGNGTERAATSTEIAG